MKCIIVYSGKGGVGKTTTSANIAKTMASEGKKVFILDGDINTPSMSQVFDSKNPHENIMVSSLGYDNKGLIYVQGSMVKKFIRQSIKEAQKFKADYLIIDTPPSITDVHINLMDTVKPSGVLMVTQPNGLSVADVNRTGLFFKGYDVPVVGIVENMCTGEPELEYIWDKIASISFSEGFDGERAYQENIEDYKKISEHLMNIDNTPLEQQKKVFFDESITEYDIDVRELALKKQLSFINLGTWDAICNAIHEQEFFMGDRLLDVTTTENIKRVLEAFEEDETAYFMVTNSPHTGNKLLTGEMGRCTFHVDSKHYGIPRVKYQTKEGDVILFPHEVKPVEQIDIDDCLAHDGVITSDNRYIPGPTTLDQILDWYGDRVGITEKWPDHYKRITGKESGFSYKTKG